MDHVIDMDGIVTYVNESCHVYRIDSAKDMDKRYHVYKEVMSSVYEWILSRIWMKCINIYICIYIQMYLYINIYIYTCI